MMTHTPGPFLVQREQDGEYSVWTRRPHTGTLATVHAEDINGRYPARENAQLFAAAPDLLFALQALESVAKYGGLPIQGELEDARAAIAKATS